MKEKNLDLSKLEGTLEVMLDDPYLMLWKSFVNVQRIKI